MFTELFNVEYFMNKDNAFIVAVSILVLTYGLTFSLLYIKDKIIKKDNK